MNYFIARRVEVHIPFKAMIKEYEVRENETVRELLWRAYRDLDIVSRRQQALLQDGRKLPDAAKLREANFDVTRPVVFARR